MILDTFSICATKLEGKNPPAEDTHFLFFKATTVKEMDLASVSR